MPASPRRITFVALLIPVAVLADPKGNYEALCTACHGFGIAGAPRVGDQEAWAPRLERGIQSLYDNAINGYTGETGVMPAKGGFTELSDEEIKAIVDYMAKSSQ